MHPDRPTTWAWARHARARAGGTASSTSIPRLPFGRARPRKCTSSTAAGRTACGPATSSATTPCSRGPRAPSAASGRPATCWTPGHLPCCERRRRRHASWCCCATRSSASARGARWRRTASRSAPRRARPPTPPSTAASTRTSCCACGASFPREQVLVLQYERCVAEPLPQLARTFDFLGLGADIPPGLDPGRRVNESRGPKVELSAWQTEVLVRRYAPENERLAALLPDLDLSLWRCRDALGGPPMAPGRPAMTLRARSRRRLVRGSRAWYRWRGPRPPGPPDPPPCPPGWHIGPPHYVGRGRPEGGHLVVGRAHRPAPVRRPCSGPAQGAALLRPRLGGTLRRRRTSRATPSTSRGPRGPSRASGRPAT